MRETKSRPTPLALDRLWRRYAGVPCWLRYLLAGFRPLNRRQVKPYVRTPGETMSKDKKYISANDIEITNHPEFGLCFSAKCPDCLSEIRELSYMSSWNILTCQCGREWSFTLHAEGVLTQRAPDLKRAAGKSRKSIKLSVSSG